MVSQLQGDDPTCGSEDCHSCGVGARQHLVGYLGVGDGAMLLAQMQT